MSIFDLDFYTIDAISNLLDIRSLYNFSRTCQKFKNVCHEIKDKRSWQKQVYGVFAKTVLDSVDAVGVRARAPCTLILIEACLNVIQYTYEVQENITARFDDNTKHSNEVIELMLALSEVLLNLNYEENCLLFVEGNDQRLTSLDDKVNFIDDNGEIFEDEKECGFYCMEVNSWQLQHHCGINYNMINKLSVNSGYYEIFKEFDIKLFLKDKDFQDLCCKIRTMTKLGEVPDTIIAMAFQMLFGPTINNLSYHKKESDRTMTTKELRLLKNQVFTLRNNNLKHILARTDLSNLIQYCTILYHFVSKEKFKDFMDDIIGFVKICISERIPTVKEKFFYENNKITAFLLQSSYIEYSERLMFFNIKDGYLKYRYHLAGSDTSLDIVYWKDEDEEYEGLKLNCAVNDINLAWTELVGFWDPDIYNKDIKKVLGFFNNFIDRNYKRKDGETVISAQYLLSFLVFLFEMTEAITKPNSYKQFYHMSLINDVHTKDSTKRKTVKNTLE